jgi:very-short-patch-repair endonuclease
VDFYCHEVRLVVAIDGESHAGRASQDRDRETYLREQGLRVLRVSNDDVFEDLEAVAEAILRAVADQRRRTP